MDDTVKSIMRSHTPLINPMIANGLAMTHIPLCEQYIDNVMRAAAKDFPPNLQYHGFTRCSPKEEFEEITRARGSSRRLYETARSNLYLVKYQFSWKGVMLPPRYVYLPFVEQAGALRLSGVKFYISPVLADKIISLSTNSVFIRLLRDKLVFSRKPHDILVDDYRTSVQIVHSEIYHRSAAMRKLQRTVNMETSLVHYLLCKYGTIGMFEKFAGVTPHIGTNKDISNELYPADQWVICRSSGLKPRGFGRRLYTSADVALAIPRHQWNLNVQSLAGGFFYVVDHFPTRVEARWLQKDYEHEESLWIVLMGHILFSGNINESTLHEDICTHLRSLDDYVDALVEVKLKELGYHCHDIYDLMGVIINNYNEWMVASSGKINSLHGKELSILPDLLFAVTSGIFKFLFKIRSASERKDLSEKEVMTIMASTIRMGAIYSVTKSGMSNNIVSTESYSGDNKFFKITSMMVPQAKSAKPSSKKRQRVNLKDPSMHLHASFADVGSYSYLPKSDPTGKSRINPHLQLTPQAEVIRSQKHLALIDSVQEAIKRS